MPVVSRFLRLVNSAQLIGKEQRILSLERMRKTNYRSAYLFDIHDGRELARLQLQDNLFNEMIEMLPQGCALPDEAHILDVACGPGGWALQVVQAYPEISAIGVDISPQMIQYARAQAEARELDMQFRIMDVLKFPWDFPDTHFDFVNARFVTGCVPIPAWETFLRECWRVLQPGGTFRSIEAVCLSAPTCPSIQELSRLTLSVMSKMGITFSPYDMSVSPVVAKLLKRIGFKELTLTPYVADISYGTPLHLSMGENLRMASKLLMPRIMQIEGISLEKLEQLHQGWDQEWNEPSFYCHWHLSGITAIKQGQELL